MMQETELIATVTAILEKELSVALGMSLPLFQLEAKQKKDKDRLKTQMSARRQETEKKRRLIRGLYENFVQGILTNEEYFELKADYEESIRTLSGEIEALEKDIWTPWTAGLCATGQWKRMRNRADTTRPCAYGRTD